MADLNDFNQKLNETVTDLTDTRNTTGEYDPRDIENNKVMAILAYVGILILNHCLRPEILNLPGSI